MKKVGAYEAKTHLSRLLDRVAKGEKVSISRKGVPIAMLVPASPVGKPSPVETIRKIRETRRGVELKGDSLKEMIRAGRRF